MPCLVWASALNHSTRRNALSAVGSLWTFSVAYRGMNRSYGVDNMAHDCRCGRCAGRASYVMWAR